MGNTCFKKKKNDGKGLCTRLHSEFHFVQELFEPPAYSCSGVGPAFFCTALVGLSVTSQLCSFSQRQPVSTAVSQEDHTHSKDELRLTPGPEYILLLFGL